MTSTPQVSYDDVNKRYLEGDLGDRYEQNAVETQILDVVDDANDRWGSQIESRISAGLLSSNRYKRVIADAVLRILRNPEGFSNESDGGYAYGKRASVASGELWFSPSDIEKFTGIVPTTTPGTIGVSLDRGWG